MAELLSVTLAEGSLHGVHRHGNQYDREEVGHQEGSPTIAIE